MSKRQITAGVFLLDKKMENVLVCHSTNSSWKLWGIPKGLYDFEDKDHINTAIREFYEETGLKLDASSLSYLGESKYKTGDKTLIAYWAVAKDPIDIESLKCSSMVATEEPFPEVDKYKWINIRTEADALYQPQKALIPRLIERIGMLGISF